MHWSLLSEIYNHCSGANYENAIRQCQEKAERNRSAIPTSQSSNAEPLLLIERPCMRHTCYARPCIYLECNITSSLIVSGKIYISRNPRIYQRRGHCTGEELVWVPWGRILQPALQILSCWCCSSRDQDGTMGPNSCPLPRSPPASGGLPNI